MALLRIATCQFPVGPRMGENASWIRRLARRARDGGARLVHFPEAALTGYAGTDLPDHLDLDPAEVRARLDTLAELAVELGVWLAVGTAHPLADHRPHNSVVIIDPRGRTAARYDKRFCSGNPAGTTGDLAHYTPGDHPTVVEIDGVRCGVLICYDYRFPELYREYRALGVQLILHSFHAGNISAERLAATRAAIGEEHARRNPSMTYPGITMPASLIAAAAANHVWISAPNSSARHSAWAAMLVRVDGVVIGRLTRHRPGALLTDIDTDAELYDSTRDWRHRAMNGVLHSGELPVL